MGIVYTRTCDICNLQLSSKESAFYTERQDDYALDRVPNCNPVLSFIDPYNEPLTNKLYFDICSNCLERIRVCLYLKAKEPND